MWKLLNHKPGLIERVQILPERNFEVKLFNRQGTELDKTKLSAGEKEIYAISLLWALISVSGKRLPILIDTPFGRLDSIHRRNLTKTTSPKPAIRYFCSLRTRKSLANITNCSSLAWHRNLQLKTQTG